MPWERFFKALETEGGKMAVLVTLIAFFVLIAIVMVMLHHTREGARTVLIGGIGTLLGILYGYLARKK